jgi:predicted NACHT family NTPase
MAPTHLNTFLAYPLSMHYPHKIAYRECSIVITCRIAEYTFENFTEVEVADFNKEQIAEFTGKWFKTNGDLQKAELMIGKLQDRRPVKELATNPLLLTLLCLIFGDGSDFPSN